MPRPRSGLLKRPALAPLAAVPQGAVTVSWRFGQQGGHIQHQSPALPLGEQGTGLGKHSHCKRDVLHQLHSVSGICCWEEAAACIQILFL